jgi:hypothetical protein
MDPVGAYGSVTYYPWDSYGSKLFVGAYIDTKLPSNQTKRNALGLLCISINNQMSTFDVKVRTLLCTLDSCAPAMQPSKGRFCGTSASCSCGATREPRQGPPPA